MANETILAINAIGLPPYAHRGLTQTLEPIPQAANARRTINGTLVDLSEAQFRKYTSTITCTDQDVPAFDGLFPGRVVTVDCVIELCYTTAGGAPAKPVVPGSSRVDGDFTFYRPRLTMMVTALSKSKDEYAASVPWSMQLEEV